MFRSIFMPTIVVSSLLWTSYYCAAQEEPEAGTSLLLTEDSFLEEVNKKPQFVMFFAPWCGHCKKLMPVWDELHEIMEGYTDSSSERQESEELLMAGVARVDCTQQTALCSQHQVTGYPTLKFFKQPDEGVRYKGGRALEELLTFIKKELGLLKEPEKDENSPDEPTAPAEYTADGFNAAIATGHHFVKFYAPWCGHCQRLAPVWDQLAAGLGSSSSVAIAKVDCTLHKAVCTANGVRGYPTLLWFTDGEQVGEKYAGDRSLDALRTFALEHAKRPSKPVQKIEEQDIQDGDTVPLVPKLQTGSVISLGEGNFRTVVDSGLTIVKFFAPWCGHCKNMAGAYEELGEKFADNEAITVAEVDCTDQENRDLCSKEEVKGFPTILVYRDGAKVSSYEGDRTTADMAQFVVGQLSHEEL